MISLENLGTIIIKNRRQSFGLFLCLLCNKKAERQLGTGQRNKSCGCIKIKHGDGYVTKLYSVWAFMKQRCLNIKNNAYKDYGGRGIKVCPEWTDKQNGFINFRDFSLSNGYQEGLEIDRIDNNVNYEPLNCRWVTHKENSRNTRRIKLTIEVVNEIIELYETNKYTQQELAEEYNINQSEISRIINNKRWN